MCNIWNYKIENLEFKGRKVTVFKVFFQSTRAMQFDDVDVDILGTAT